MEKIIYKSEAYQIIGICMDVYNTFGYGFSEIVYKDAMELEFMEKEVGYMREDKQKVNYKGQILNPVSLQISPSTKILLLK